MLLAFLRRHIWALTLVIISLVVCFLNFEPNTWLTGWDTLHPEFDFSRNLGSMLSGAWREDQGLGALAAHAHMSDLPRLLMLWLFSLVMPLMWVKYAYIFGCLVLGPLGVYYLLRYLLSPSKPATQPILAASFVGALWYLFNLGTVQHFYVVFEMFAVQYAALGWLFLFATRAVAEPKKRWLGWFGLASVLSAPMAYSSLLWFAFAGSLTVYLTGLSLLSKKFAFFFAEFKVLAVLVLTNSFWLLPNLYFILFGSSRILKQAHINELFSPEAFYHNQAYGNLFDLALLKNFLFNWLIYKHDNYSLLLEQWQRHVDSPLVITIGIGIFVMAVGGFLLSWRPPRPSALILPYSLVAMVSIFMLINANPPFTGIFLWLQQNSSLFQEGMRYPFTKFSLVYMLSFAVFLAHFFQHFFVFLTKNPHTKFLLYPVASGIVASLLFFGAPMFQGQLLSPLMRNTIPTEYFSLFQWANQQNPQARLVTFPVETHFGWDYYQWNYQGPGFVWFGIPQPLVVRDFDRWSPYNETLYSQLSTAVYQRDEALLSQVIQQYDLSFALIDESIYAPGKPSSVQYFDETKQLLTKLDISPVWQQGKLTVYDLRKLQPNSSFVYAPETAAKANGATQFGRINPIYQQHGPYVSWDDEPIYYPFADLMREKLSGISYDTEKMSLERSLPTSLTAGTVVVPQPASGSTYLVPTQFYFDGQIVKLDFQPAFSVEVDQVASSPASLADTAITVAPAAEKIFLNVHDQFFELTAREATFSATLHLKFNEPITYDYFSESDLQKKDGEYFVEEKSIQRGSIAATAWEPLQSNFQLPFAQAEGIKVTLASTPLSIRPSQVPTTINCDAIKRGSFAKTTQDQTAIYHAVNRGAACEGTSIQEMTTENDFFIRWQGHNKAGRSLKIYVQNLATQKADLEHLLPEGSFDASYSLIAWPNLPTSGYILNWETRSFGNQPSENELQPIQVYPVPLSALSQLVVIPPHQSTQLINHTAITQQAKHGTFWYQVKLNNSQPDGLVVLSQSFDKGWIGFKTPPTLKAWFSVTVLPHHLYNGWANAWVLPAGEYDLTIIFWPQLLSLLGFAGLAITALVGGILFLRWRFKKH